MQPCGFPYGLLALPAVIGEEAAAEAGGTPRIGAEPTWIIDPIDGTQACAGVREYVGRWTGQGEQASKQWRS